MNTQEAYEKMRAWLTRPGATRAWDDEVASCTYLADDGNRCAVGALLSAETLERMRTTVKSDGQETFGLALSLTYVAKHFPHALQELKGIDWDFLRSAQRIHDTDEFWHDGSVGHRLDKLARDYGLTVVTDEPVVVPDYPPVEERTLVEV